MNQNTFTLLIKKELVDNRKPLLLGLTGIWATYILLGAFLGYVQSYLATEIFLFSFFGGLLVSIGASLAFNNMKTKEVRISSIMLPATPFQKFILRWIAAIPLMIAVVIIGFLLGDWARLIVFRIVKAVDDMHNIGALPANVSIISFIREELLTDYESIIFIICGVLSVILCSQSLYFLGAILWPKLSFIKSWAAMQVLGVMAAIVLGTINMNFSLSVAEKISFSAVMWTLNSFTFLFCISIYWLAYLRFRRSQVIYKLF